MQKLKNCDYYIGLDMGDASVGWAVTDTNYNILNKVLKKAMSFEFRPLNISSLLMTPIVPFKAAAIEAKIIPIR